MLKPSTGLRFKQRKIYDLFFITRSWADRARYEAKYAPSVANLG